MQMAMSLRGSLIALAVGLAAARHRHATLAADGGGAAGRLLRGSSSVVNWDYSEHGRNWNMGQCCIGVGQSPLNVSKAVAVEPDGELLFHAYRVHEEPVRMLNDGRRLVAELDSRIGSIGIGRAFPGDLTDLWDLWKIEAHAPSEHTFEGRTVALELQLYHKRRGTVGEPSPDAIAVVAFGFVASASPLGFVNALRQGGLPASQGTETLVNRVSPARLDFTKLFGPSGGTPYGQAGTNPLPGFWQYTGSLTSPPCSVGVQWFVRHDPLPAAHAALDEFRNVILSVGPVGVEGSDKGNTRSLQPSCGRTIMLRLPKDASSELNSPFATAVTDAELQGSLNEAQATKDQSEQSVSDQPPTSAKYQDCLAELSRAEESLKTAEAQQDLWCKAEQDAMAKLEGSGVGVTRLVAGSKLTEARSQCKAETQVVASLKEEIKHVTPTCATLRLKAVAAGRTTR